MRLHTRVGKSPWGAQMPNCTTACTRVFSMEEIACTAHHAARNSRCKRQRPLWNHLDQRTWLRLTRAPTDLARPPSSAREPGLEPDHSPGVRGGCSGGPTYSFSQPRRTAAGEGISQRWVVSNSFLLGADKSLRKPGNV